MDRLWAPWRLAYVQSGGKGKKGGCVFCDAGKGRKSPVLFKTRYSSAMLNIFPYNNGHTMVAPLRHTGRWHSLSPQEGLDLFAALSRVMRVLDSVLKPDGYNIGVNLGRAAGAGIPGHLHLHVVPRWDGDTNFMPVAGGTKVISQSLEEMYKRFRETDKKIQKK